MSTAWGVHNHVDLGTNAETIATINVDGAENLRICGDALNQDTLTTFDASAATGDVTAIFEGANDGAVDVIGGDGNDNFWFLVTDPLRTLGKTKVRRPSQRTTLSMAAMATIRLPSKPSKERCSGPALVQISQTLPPSCTQPTSTHAFSSVTTASSIPCRVTCQLTWSVRARRPCSSWPVSMGISRQLRYRRRRHQSGKWRHGHLLGH